MHTEFLSGRAFNPLEVKAQEFEFDNHATKKQKKEKDKGKEKESEKESAGSADTKDQKKGLQRRLPLKTFSEKRSFKIGASLGIVLIGLIIVNLQKRLPSRLLSPNSHIPMCSHLKYFLRASSVGGSCQGSRKASSVAALARPLVHPIFSLFLRSL